MDKRKLNRRAEPAMGAGNSSGVSLETLHQLAASYFIDRESTLRRLHHIQIATAAIKVGEGARGRAAQGDSGPSKLAETLKQHHTLGRGDGRGEQANLEHPRYLWEIGHANEGTFFSGLQAGLPPVNKPISRQLVLFSKHCLATGSGAWQAWPGVICSTFGGVAGASCVPDGMWVPRLGDRNADGATRLQQLRQPGFSELSPGAEP